MEYKYYRELKHNYLVLENKGEDQNEDNAYQYRIAGSGRVKELLPCSVRSINGEKFYYYEIGSMQSIKDRFSVSGMKQDDIAGLLGSIRSLLENLSEFLMTDEGIVFSAKNIYTDLTSGEYRFMFCPFYDESRSFSDLAMELLELVDENDEKATEIVYNLCEKASVRGDFVYQIIEEILETKEDAEERAALPVENDLMQTVLASDEEEDPDENGPDSVDSGRMQRAKKRLGGRMQLLFSLLFLGVVGAMVYIRKNFVLSDQENLLSILVMLVSTVTGVVALVGGLMDMKKAGSANEPGKKKEPDEDEDLPEIFDEDEITKEYPVFEEPKPAMRPVMKTAGTAQKREATMSFECGETVVLGDDLCDEMALFSRNLDKTVRIALGKLPITVGKMEGCVDRVLKDASISRMHCRFVAEGDRVAVLDLGSTNGTYRNGVRLKPQERTFIEEGDEIRIGRVCFDCR